MREETSSTPSIEDDEDDLRASIEETEDPLGSKPTQSVFIISRRDWEAFCATLAQLELSEDSTCLQLDIRLNGYPAHLPDYKGPITDFFTSENQRNLLKPFSTHIRGFQHVNLLGDVDQKLAEEVRQHVSQSPWTDPRQVLSHLHFAANVANALSNSRQMFAAGEGYQTLITKIRSIDSNTSQSLLVHRGGPYFLTSLAKLDFETVTSYAQFHLMNAPYFDFPASERATLGIYASVELHCARNSFRHWQKKGSTYAPTHSQEAYLASQRALCWRIIGQASPNDAGAMDVFEKALTYIEDARSLAPDLQSVLDEICEIKKWADSIGYAWVRGKGYRERLAGLA